MHKVNNLDIDSNTCRCSSKSRDHSKERGGKIVEQDDERNDTLNPNTTSNVGFRKGNNAGIISLISQGRRGIIAGVVGKEVS